jgi:hypothetical protein
MNTWRIGIVGAVLLAGCTGTIENGEDQGRPGGVASPGPASPGAGTPGTGTPGTGTPGTGTPGTGAPGTGTPGTGTPGTGTPGTGTTACTQGVPGTSQLPRLTRAQYDNTIRDLMGITSGPSAMLAPDTPGSVDQRAWDGYKAAADALSAQVLADAAVRSKVVTCYGGEEASCAKSFIADFGKRAFRRTLTAEEQARFEAMYTDRANLTATGTFDEVIQLIVRSILISPSFLTRAEFGQTAEGALFALSGFEVASRLSYMLWGSMPDEQLFQAAEANQLATASGVLDQAKRMLADPKARSKVSAFHEHYAHMGEGTRWAAIQRDPGVYPMFQASMVPALADETKRLFDYVVFDLAGSFRDLLTTPVAFVNATTAPLYGLDPSKYGAELTKVDLDPAQRPGVFTRAGFLTAYSLYNRPSAILRGAFIQKDVLCAALGSPPANAESTPLPTAGLATNRLRTDAQTAAAECASCHHQFINPTGFALESFDAIGNWQTTEKDTGATIDTVATVPVGGTMVSVAGPADLMKVISESPAARACYAKHWVQFAYERVPTEQDACTVQSMAEKLTQTGYKVVDLIADLTQSQSFRFRAMEVAP